MQHCSSAKEHRSSDSIIPVKKKVFKLRPLNRKEDTTSRRVFGSICSLPLKAQISLTDHQE